jgi:hypothetical protein
MKAATVHEARARSKWVLTVIALVGFLLIFVSRSIPAVGVWDYIREFVKELGIVLLAVYTVSFVYEVAIAERHLDHFMSLLRKQVQGGEDNKAMCAQLGIERIFPRRDKFEIEYPFSDYISALGTGAKVRIVGRSLFHTMTFKDSFKEALKAGASVELCLFDPNSKQIAKSPGLRPGEIQTAVDTFRKEIAGWAETEKPIGIVAPRYHEIPLLDSLFSLNSPEKRFCIWDVSFGIVQGK